MATRTNRDEGDVGLLALWPASTPPALSGAPRKRAPPDESGGALFYCDNRCKTYIMPPVPPITPIPPDISGISLCQRGKSACLFSSYLLTIISLWDNIFVG